MKKIEQFQITGMTIDGFKCYQIPTILDFGPQTVITGGNGRGKTSIADAIVAEGQEQRTQLDQLQQLDAKAQVVFDQFQSDDIIKMQDEIDALDRQRAKLTEDRQTDDLREQIRQLNISLEYGNLYQQEYDQLSGCRAELLQCQAQLRAAEAALSQKPEDFDAQMAQTQREIKDLKVPISIVLLWRCGLLVPLQPLRRSRQQRHAVRPSEWCEQQTGFLDAAPVRECLSHPQAANASKHGRAAARCPEGAARRIHRYAGAFDPSGQAP